ESLKSSIVSISNISTSLQAETLAATIWYNVNLLRRTNEQDDLIHFEPREYNSGPTTPMTIYYKIQLDKKEVDNDHIVIKNPDDIPVLLLYDIISKTQINNSIIASLEPGTRLEHNWFLQIPQVHFNNISPPPQRAYQQKLDKTVDEYYNKLERLYSSRNGMPNNHTTSIEKAKATKAVYFRKGPLSSYSLKRCYLSHEESATEEIGELKKAISNMAQKTTSREVKSARKIEKVDASDNVLPIEVAYCEAAVEQHPIYLILDTGFSKSLVSHKFLKKIRKEIDKPSIRTLIDVHKQRKYLLGVVENLLIIVNKIEILIDIEVTEAKDYIIIIENKYISIEGRRVPIQNYSQYKEGIQNNNLKKIKYSYKGQNTIYWCEKSLNYETNSCAICRELFKRMETLECLVDDLDEKLDIKKKPMEDSKLEEEQQA
ncbi:11514_t:CDS:2, partial [Gigaspora margarita]